MEQVKFLFGLRQLQFWCLLPTKKQSCNLKSLVYCKTDTVVDVILGKDYLLLKDFSDPLCDVIIVHGEVYIKLGYFNGKKQITFTLNWRYWNSVLFTNKANLTTDSYLRSIIAYGPLWIFSKRTLIKMYWLLKGHAR